MEKLFALFEEIGLPYYRQGSLSDADYPPEFFTFWNIDTPNLRHRDNKVKEYAELVQIGYYTDNAEKIFSQIDKDGEFHKKAKAKGFVFYGRAKDAPSDKENYSGRVCYIRIIHKQEG